MSPSFVFVVMVLAMVPSGQAAFSEAYEGGWFLDSCNGGVLEGRKLPEDILSMIVYNSVNVSTNDWYDFTGDGITKGYVSGDISYCKILKEPSTEDAKFLQNFWFKACDAPRNYDLSKDGKRFEVEFPNEAGKPKCTYVKFIKFNATMDNSYIERIRKQMLSQIA